MCIAFVFWLFTKLSSEQKTVLEVAVNYDIPYNKILKQAPPKHLTVNLKGEGWDLLKRALNGEPKMVNLSLLKKDRLDLSYPELQELIGEKVSNRLEIISISPASVQLELDEPITKIVPLDLKANVSTISQYQLASKIQLIPDKISLTGPKSVVSNIEKAETNLLVINKLNANQFDKIAISPFDNKQVTYTPKAVNYVISVEPISEKILDIPIEENDSIKVLPSVVKLSCTIGLSKYPKLKSDDFQIDIVPSSLNEEDGTVRLRLTKAPNAVDPSKVLILPKRVRFFRVKKED